tara:strand:+ start:329 stop:541 length:213 start_codon:yes stop_codon:yes gene_type:complete
MILNNELDLSINFLKKMATAKKRQIELEPTEVMWREELTQLERTIGLMEMERESYEQGEQVDVIQVQRLQ